MMVTPLAAAWDEGGKDVQNTVVLFKVFTDQSLFHGEFLSFYGFSREDRGYTPTLTAVRTGSKAQLVLKQGVLPPQDLIGVLADGDMADPEGVGALGDSKVALHGHDAVICGQHRRAARVQDLGVAVGDTLPLLLYWIFSYIF